MPLNADILPSAFESLSDILIVVDVQKNWVGAVRNGDDFVRKTIGFINQAREYMPIIQVTFDRDRRSSNFLKGKQLLNAVEDWCFYDAQVADTDEILVKNEMSAVCPALLARLGDPSFVRPIVVGVQTSACIAETVRHLLLNGYSCSVIPEHTADHVAYNYTNTPESNEENLRRLIESRHPEYMPRLTFPSAQDILRGHELTSSINTDGAEPALPEQRASAQALREQRFG